MRASLVSIRKMNYGAPPCPVCGNTLKDVPRNYMLNRYQDDAVRLGDWWCPTCDPEKVGRKAYFYDKNLEHTVLYSVPQCEAITGG